MKDDVEIPTTVPRKRRQLRQAPDKWLAVWLTHDDLRPSERRWLEEEKERRRGERKREQRVVGLVVAREGMTPPQFLAVGELIRGSFATELLHTRLAPKMHGALAGACRFLQVPLRLVDDVRDRDAAARTVAREVDLLIAAPREATVQTYATPGVWSVIGYARNRRTPVRVVLPDGQLQQGEVDG